MDAIKYNINNSNFVLEHSRCIYIKTYNIVCETRRLSYFIFHANRCKKPSDIIKLTLMAVATMVLITKLVLSILEQVEVLMELIFTKPRFSIKHMCKYIGGPETDHLYLLPEGKPHLNQQSCH